MEEPAFERARGPEAELLLAQAGWVRRLAVHLVQDRDRADDLIQETWRRALERRNVHDTSERGLRAWLARVLRNLAADQRSDADLRRWHESSAGRPKASSTEGVAERILLAAACGGRLRARGAVPLRDHPPLLRRALPAGDRGARGHDAGRGPATDRARHRHAPRASRPRLRRRSRGVVRGAPRAGFPVESVGSDLLTAPQRFAHGYSRQVARRRGCDRDQQKTPRLEECRGRRFGPDIPSQRGPKPRWILPRPNRTESRAGTPPILCSARRPRLRPRSARSIATATSPASSSI